MRFLIVFLIAIASHGAIAQSLQMDSCKYFAELVNAERAKRFKKKLAYQESSQAKLDKSASQLVFIYNHRLTEKCSEVICKTNSIKDNFKMLMMSPGHRKILMGRAKKICVGIFKKDGTYYLCARTY